MNQVTSASLRYPLSVFNKKTLLTSLFSQMNLNIHFLPSFFTSFDIRESPKPRRKINLLRLREMVYGDSSQVVLFAQCIHLLESEEDILLLAGFFLSSMHFTRSAGPCK